jgi:hypothetical protein
MALDWTRIEVEATVADYFDMLDKQLRGLEYNKTAYRRHLAGLLNNRSDGAIERKHQNISAILIKLSFPYIIGYKPLSNYQRLLFEVVSDRLEKSHTLSDMVQKQIKQPAVTPTMDDILASLVRPPTPIPREIRRTRSLINEPTKPFRHADYLAQEASNGSLGLAGERFIVEYEKARLTNVGREKLAAKVEHVSLTQGDGAGFDILSFEESGKERYIEVKTTAYGEYTPFFVTPNELNTSHKVPSDYYLYRAFEFRQRPRFFTKQGPLDQSFSLDPSQYMAKLV